MSLHDKSLLVSLTLAGIASTRADKEITADVLSAQNAGADAGRWLSRRWPREAMDPIRALDSQIRAHHYLKTLPWGEKGERIIASRTFTDYIADMRNFRYKRETLVQGFLDHYDDWIDQARLMRGHLFKVSEYPTVHQARNRFRFELGAQPIPHRDDFRVSLAALDMEAIQISLDQKIRDAELIARRDLYRRMAEPVCKLLERLSDPDARFTDATLNALREIVATLPDVNVLDDPEVELLRQSIEEQLCRLDPESITTSRSDRSRAAAKANTILAKMAPWLDEVNLDEEEAAA
ncbi:MAG: hypothetical protein V4819_16440 [Verrucomicrobiota bacterium]